MRLYSSAAKKKVNSTSEMDMWTCECVIRRDEGIKLN